MDKNSGRIHFNSPGVDKGMIEVPLSPKLITATAYTIQDADVFHELMFACTADTVITIPNAATIVNDKEITIAFTRVGLAMLTFVAQSGVSLDIPADVVPPLRLPFPGAQAILNRTGLNDWQIYGDFVVSGAA